MATEAPTSRSAARSATPSLFVAGITIVALMLRLASFRESFYGDELFTYEIATRPGLGAVLDGVRSSLEITPPLYFLVAWVFQHAGDPLVWLRVPSLLAGVATVPLVWVLGRRTVGDDAALVGAAFFALSPLAVFYATEARAYSLMALLIVSTALVLLRAIETNDPRWWVALAFVQAGAMYSHYTSIFVLAAMAAWAICTQRHLLRPLLLSYAGSVILFLPWLPAMAEDRDAPAQSVMAALAPFNGATALSALGRLADGGPFAPLDVLPGPVALVLLGASAVIGLCGLLWHARRSGPVVIRPRVVLIVLMALAAPAGAAVYSAVGGDLFLARNLISSLPALCLAFAALLTALPRRPALVALMLAFGALGLGVAASFSPSTQRPAYDEVAAFLERHAQPGDVVIELNVASGPPARALEVQLDPSIPVFSFGEQHDAVQAAEAGRGRILYVRPELRGLAAPEEVEQSFRVVSRETWEGLYPMTVVVYEPITGQSDG